MPHEKDEILVVTDKNGTLYLIRRSTLEQGRVSDDHRPVVEQFLKGEEAAGISMLPRSSADQFKIIQSFGVELVDRDRILDALRNL